MIEKNKLVSKIIYLFLIFQPIIDLLTSLTVRLTNSTLTIGMLSRGLFLVFMVIYFLFFNQSKLKKKSVIYFVSLFFFYGIYLVTKSDGFSFSFFKREMTYAFKYFYFPILTVCLVNMIDAIGLKKEKIMQLLIVNLIVYAVLIFVPEITGTAFSTYEWGKKGTTGWFFAGNEIGAIVVCLLPYLYLLIQKRFVAHHLFLAFTFVLYSIAIIGTKTSFFGVLLTVSFYLIYFFLKEKRIAGMDLKQL